MVEATQTFSLARLTELSQTCAADAENIPTEAFCDLLDNIVLLLKEMGSMMSMAFSGKYLQSFYKDLWINSSNTFKIWFTDVNEKSVIMKKNKAFMIANFQKDAELSLNGMIDEEIAQGVAECNGDNNSKKVDKSKK